MTDRAALRRHAAQTRVIADVLINALLRKAERREAANPEAAIDRLYRWRDRLIVEAGCE